MDTQFTIKAKELRDLYSSITQPHFTKDERLDVLLTLKHTVKVISRSVSQIITTYKLLKENIYIILLVNRSINAS